MNLNFALVVSLITWHASLCNGKKYTPDWESLDTHPLPAWYDAAKVGVFIHWGVYSVPAFENEWFWWNWKGWPQPEFLDFMQKHYPPDFAYQDFAHEFTASFYDPNEWADIFEASGAKYVVITAKHHEGFCMWPSQTSWNWNSFDIGPKRDIVGELADAIRSKTDIRFGVYHSLFEWFNPLFLSDEESLFTKRDFVLKKSMPEMFDLVNRYKPDIFWSDGNWIGVDSYWNSTGFVAWLYNESPVKDTIVVNDRWGAEDECQHGDIHTCTDRYNPGVIQEHKWENCMSLDKESFGYRKNMKLAEVISIQELIGTLVETVSCGGNILINVGPTKDGIIVPVFEERLRQLGAWLKVNGEAIYESRPWKHQNDTTNPDVWYTMKGDTVYAILLKYPVKLEEKLILSAPLTTRHTTVELLGYAGKVAWTRHGSWGFGIEIDMSKLKEFNIIAWVFKLENVK